MSTVDSNIEKSTLIPKQPSEHLRSLHAIQLEMKNFVKSLGPCLILNIDFDSMKVYLVDITTRKNDRDETLGPFSTFDKAKEALRKHFSHWTEEELREYTEYDSNYDKGCIFTEEESAEIFEREME